MTSRKVTNMELARKQRLCLMNICRFCLSSSNVLHSLFDDQISRDKLSLQILSCISVEVFPSDFMPRYICDRCMRFMNICYEFKKVCREADNSIMKHLQKGSSLKRIPWPTVLVQEALTPLKEEPLMETLADGTTVQVSLEGGSDTDEGQDVYHVKVGTGAKDVSVLQSSQERKSKQTKIVNPEQGEKLKCSHCPKVFVKYAHYARHIETKHQQTCEQCGKKFGNQDDLIYHSAVHATQNLTCPLCMEKFQNVEDVTAHIKSHVNAKEFMCDFCELVFLTNDKLEAHLVNAHDKELQMARQDMELDESSMEIRSEEDEEEDNGLRVKQVGDEMIVEINKPDSFMLNSSQEEIEKLSDGGESQSALPDVNSDVAVITKLPQSGSKPDPVTVVQNAKIQDKESQPAILMKKAEEVKRKIAQKPLESAADRRPKPVTKPDNVMTATNDKSLRLLEKELQELKRTNTRTEAVKTPVKPVETLRSRRPQITTSTPKPKPVEDRKPITKTPAVEKKLPEKRVITKENKEPKESKLPTNDKEVKEEIDDEEKEESDKEKKEKKDVEKEIKETPKSAVKNGSSEKDKSEEVIRRSNRPSKIKDYARLVRDKPQNEEDETDEDDDDEEYKEEKPLETRKRRSSHKALVKAPPAAAVKPPAAPAAAPAPRKRGRPRKDDGQKDNTPAKLKKENLDESDDMDTSQPEKEVKTENITEIKSEKKPLLVSPSGQTLKQVPIKSLPPGVKPLPLPAMAKKVNSSEVCEMQIGKKVVKVQKIMMTKAEVEAMAKKGLVEFKDGTMVLKQGIKLPTSNDPSTIKSSLVGEAVAQKESPKKEAATPTRCDLEDAA